MCNDKADNKLQRSTNKDNVWFTTENRKPTMALTLLQFVRNRLFNEYDSTLVRANCWNGGHSLIHKMEAGRVAYSRPISVHQIPERIEIWQSHALVIFADFQSMYQVEIKICFWCNFLWTI